MGTLTRRQEIFHNTVLNRRVWLGIAVALGAIAVVLAIVTAEPVLFLSLLAAAIFALAFGLFLGDEAFHEWSWSRVKREAIELIPVLVIFGLVNLVIVKVDRAFGTNFESFNLPLFLGIWFGWEYIQPRVIQVLRRYLMRN